MKAAGTSLVVSELVSELPWGSDQLPVIVTYLDGYCSVVLSAELDTTQLSLGVDEDSGSETFRDLLGKVTELLNKLTAKPGKFPRFTSGLRDQITNLANEIEEAL